jgi:hypothetical protein
MFKLNLRNVVKIVAILVVFSANNLLAQDKLEIPKWLTTGWFGPDAKYTDEWLFEVTSKGEIKYKAADAKENEFKTGQITAIEEKTKPVTYGNKMNGTITFTVDGKNFSINYSNYSPSNAYGMPAYLSIAHINVTGAKADDPIFGKLAKESYKFSNLRGFSNVKKRPIEQPFKVGKLPGEIVGKFYTKLKSAYCQNEKDFLFEIAADGTFKYKKNEELVTGTIQLINYQKAGSMLKGNLLEAYNALRIEVDGEIWYESAYAKQPYVDGVNVKGTQVLMNRLNCWNPQDKNVTVIAAGRGATNFLFKEGSYSYAVKKPGKPGECEEFDERIVAMWYMDKPKAAQWGQDKISAENKFWDFIIIEEKGKYYYCLPDMMEAGKIGTKNRISNPGEGVLKMGKNEMTFQIEGNKLQVKGAASTGFTMGAQIKTGTYYKYDPDGPTVDDSEVTIEIGKQAVDLFKK